MSASVFLSVVVSTVVIFRGAWSGGLDISCRLCRRLLVLPVSLNTFHLRRPELVTDKPAFCAFLGSPVSGDCEFACKRLSAVTTDWLTAGREPKPCAVELPKI